MKLSEIAPPEKLNFNTQAKLAIETSAALKKKFGYVSIMQLYDHGGSGEHHGSGNIFVTLTKPTDVQDSEFICPVMLPWLRDNLAKLLKRPVSNVARSDTTFDGKKKAQLLFTFDFML